MTLHIEDERDLYFPSTLTPKESSLTSYTNLAFLIFSGEQLEYLQLCLQHVLFLILGMVTLSFINAHPATRLALLLVVPTNLFVSSQQGRDKALDLPGVAIVLAAFAACKLFLANNGERASKAGSLATLESLKHWNDHCLGKDLEKTLN